MTRKESPAQILNSIAGRTLGGLLLIPGIPLAIVGMLAFDICVTLADAICATRAWKWFVGRRG